MKEFKEYLEETKDIKELKNKSDEELKALYKISSKYWKNLPTKIGVKSNEIKEKISDKAKYPNPLIIIEVYAKRKDISKIESRNELKS